MTPDIARYIDHTMVRPDTSEAQIAQLCQEATDYHLAAVAVNPVYVHMCSQMVLGSGVAVASAISFPLGATSTRVKSYEAQQAIEDGATELDMVINVGALKSSKYDVVHHDIAAITRICHDAGAICKVVIEAALLTDDEKVKACQLAESAGADFVKTSTGFGPGGATVHDVTLMRGAVSPHVGIKAAGGISTYRDFQALLDAGATRIGTSASVKIIQQAQSR